MGPNDKDSTTQSGNSWLEPPGRAAEEEASLGLVVAWSLAEPRRVGEIAFVPEGDGDDRILGRGEAERGLAFVRQRPGRIERRPPLGGSGISRRQAIVRVRGDEMTISRVGRAPLRFSGRAADEGVLGPGDTLSIGHQLVLLCVRRAYRLAALRAYPSERFGPFGEPDPYELVGESPAMWELRDQIAFAARAEVHVLLFGESGTGKELAARAIHGLSRRAGKPLVARNAATIPETLIDAELFGHAKDYPNAGMTDRPGLIGESDGSTLFLDELAELPGDMQGHLLRVLDSGGEYHRLGEARTRRADLRLVAATNRPPGDLKHDLQARLALRITLPGLGARLEDVPLLLRNLLCRIARQNPEIGERYFLGWDGRSGEPRIDPALVEHLLRHRYTHHVRELEAALWSAIGSSRRDFVELTREVQTELERADGRVPSRRKASRPPVRSAPTLDEIRAALDRAGGAVTQAARDLGLTSRFALYRLMKKHGLPTRPG